MVDLLWLGYCKSLEGLLTLLLPLNLLTWKVVEVDIVACMFEQAWHTVLLGCEDGHDGNWVYRDSSI